MWSKHEPISSALQHFPTNLDRLDATPFGSVRVTRIGRKAPQRRVPIIETRRNACCDFFVPRRRLGRDPFLNLFEKLPSCRVGVQAWAAARHQARDLAAMGHKVKLVPQQNVKPALGNGASPT